MLINFFLATSVSLLFLPIIIRIKKIGYIDPKDPIYIILLGFFLYFVLPQTNTNYSNLNLGLLNELIDFSHQTKVSAMKFVLITIFYFCVLDFIFFNKSLNLEFKIFRIKKKESIIFFFTLLFISIIFMYLNFTRFGNFFDFIFQSLSKGERFFKIRQEGNYPFDTIFYFSFIAGIVLLNYFIRNIFKSILIICIIFLPIFFYKFYVFDRSYIVKHLLFLLFLILIEKKFYVYLHNYKKIFILLFISIFCFYFFSVLGEFRKSIQNFIYDKNFTFQDLSNNYDFDKETYIREFKNTNLGFLYLIENKDFISNNKNYSYYFVFYNNLPRKFLKLFNNLKEKDQMNITGKNLTNLKNIDSTNRDHPISITNHPLTEAYYNFKELGVFVAGLLIYVIYRIVKQLAFSKNYFISRSSIMLYPALFLFFRAPLSSFMSQFFYLLVYFVIFATISYLFIWMKR